MPDWPQIFTQLHARRSFRAISFREAVASGSGVAYPTDLSVDASVRYREVGFDPTMGVLYPMNRVELHIWLRDWFARSDDGATDAELADLIRRLKGDVREGDREHYSRFVFDGASQKYDSHMLDERPDGVIYAVLVMLQAV